MYFTSGIAGRPPPWTSNNVLEVSRFADTSNTCYDFLMFLIDTLNVKRKTLGPIASETLYTSFYNIGEIHQRKTFTTY